MSTGGGLVPSRPPPRGPSVRVTRSKSSSDIAPCFSTTARIQSSRPFQYDVPNSTIGKCSILARLRQGQRLEELVERAQAAWEDHESPRVLDEHVLAHEEVAELDAEVDVCIQLLLARQLDLQPTESPPAS